MRMAYRQRDSYQRCGQGVGRPSEKSRSSGLAADSILRLELPDNTGCPVKLEIEENIEKSQYKYDSILSGTYI